MDDLSKNIKQTSIYKSPRTNNPSILDPNLKPFRKSDENDAKKMFVFPSETNPPLIKATLSKTPGGALNVQSSLSSPNPKVITPKVLRNLANRNPLQDSGKKVDKVSKVSKGRESVELPHFTHEEKQRLIGSTDDIDKIQEQYALRDAEDYRVDRKDFENVSRRASQKLPAINNKKAVSKTEVKKKYDKRNDTKMQTLGMGRGEIEFNVVMNTSSKVTTLSQSNSPLKDSKSYLKFGSDSILEDRRDRSRKRDEEERDTSIGKSYSEDKVRMIPLGKSEEKMSPVLKKLYAKGNLSGGEEEENTGENLNFSLVISTLKGAQRVAKPLKKRVEVLKERRALTPEEKEKSQKTLKVKKAKTEGVKENPEKKKIKKKKEKVEKEKEKEEEKDHDRVGRGKGLQRRGSDGMEGWDKEDSEYSNDKGLEDEEEVKPEDDEAGEEDNIEKEQSTSRKLTLKDEEEKTPTDLVDKSKEKSKIIAGALRKSTMGNIGGKEGVSKSDAVVAMVGKVHKSHHHISKTGENKDKDSVQLRRELAYKEFMLRLNFSFNVQVKVPVEKTFIAYKYFLGKGNNSMMIKAMMKQRWWWVQVDNKDAADINFMWTQLKVNKFVEGLKQRRKTPFETLENNSGVSSLNANDTTTNTTTTIDSISEGESDTTDNDLKTSGKKVKKAHSFKKKRRSLVKKGTTEIVVKSQEDITASSMKKLFTSNEIMLMNTLADSKGNMPIYPEDYEEVGKMKKGPTPQVIADPSTMKMCNHLESNYHLANKKALLWNMKSYYEAIKENVFDHLPLTFHVRNGFEDKEYQRFLEYYNNREKEIQEQEKLLQEGKDKDAKEGKDTKEGKEGKKGVKKLRNLWIVKPGEGTNRGIGITVCDGLSQIKDIIATTEGNTNGRKRTYLIQQYLDRPFLYNKRKFDIRCYILMTTINNTMKGYWYQEGYIRTASKEFSLKNVTNKFIHLTNDAVQKKADEYGKFEAGNKLSYNDFQKYLDTHYDGNINFNTDIYPQIRQLAIDSIKGVYGKMDPYRRENSFEVFGLDFMIDTSLKAWLIEVNTNPDINASSPALTRVIPNMVENALRLTIDQMFPPPAWQLSKKLTLPENLLENNKFELVFDEVEDGPALRTILQPDKGATGDLILEIVAEEKEEEENDAEVQD